MGLRGLVFNALLGAILFASTTVAQAQFRARTATPPPGPYVGISVGDTNYGTGIKVFGGASMTPQVGWEAQFVDFGHDRGRGFDSNAWALGASIMGYLPVQRKLTAFGKLGLHYARGEASAFGTRVHDSSLELGIGIGALLQFMPQYALRVEAENIGGGSGLDLISVGVQMKF